MKIRLFDRSRTVEDWKCPRSRYWRYEFLGRGIVPKGTSLELFLGTATHDALSSIALMHLAGEVDIDAICAAARKQIFDALLADNPDDPEIVDFAYEQSTLIEGMTRGFHKHVWPRLIGAYPHIIAVERELTYPLAEGKHVFMSKPDLVLASEEGEHVYLEYKTTSSKKSEWVNSWNTAVQLHSTLRAIQSTLKVEVGAVIVQGLYKGYESYGKQASPFCYAYRRTGNPPFTQNEVSYEYKSGMRRVPVWEMSGGVKKWVEDMPENVLADQFPCTPPIFVNDALVDAFFAQRLARETEIDIAMDLIQQADTLEEHERLLNEYFPQKFDQCIPYFGRSCAFRTLCFGHNPAPLQQGYTLRESHHQLEREQHEKEVKSE